MIIDYTTSKFLDLPHEKWFTKNVSYLFAMRIVDGYENNTFRPNGDVTVDAFIKMIVTALGYEIENGTEYWASNFINKSIELELVKEKELTNYRRQITRFEMSRMLARTLSDDDIATSIDKDKLMLKDYESMPEEYKEYVTQVMAAGLMTGYEDGEFKGDKRVTRAEAATTILRLLDIDSRVKY